MKKNIASTRKRKVRNVMFMLLGIIFVCIIACFAVLLALSPGKLTQFTDENGNVLENSISEKVFVEVNNTEMGMIIKGKDVSNPVMLFVHGGPGMTEYFLEADYPTGLEDYFTVVWWDQRGAGLSYHGDIDESTMTAEQFIDDTIAVTNYLRERFGQDRIYLMAHSWGTFIAIQAAAKAPQLYSAYIGVEQATYQNESERLAYEYMLQYYENLGDHKTAAKIKKVDYRSDEYAGMRDAIMHKAGIGTTRDMESVVSGVFLASLKNKEYTLSEKLNIWKGKIFSRNTSLFQEMAETDLRKIIQKLDIPVYLFSGVYDYTVNYKMSENYFVQLSAPVKGFYLFKNSAHSPIFEEPDKVVSIMINDVLNGTNSMADDK